MDGSVLKSVVEDWDKSRKAELFDWLMTQMRGGSLQMDGTQWWGLPLRVLSPHRTQTPQEAVIAAKEKWDRDVAEYNAKLTQPSTGAQE